MPAASLRVVVAPDKFKGTLAASKAALAIAAGLRRTESGLFASARFDLCPLADGGEGTVGALVTATSGRLVEIPAHDPLGRPISARYGLLGDGMTAVVELAAASGLHLVSAAERDAGRATTLGTGELIAAALASGCKRLVLGLGGSATTDGGTGMARALGYRFLDGSGRELPWGGAALAELARIEPPAAVAGSALEGVQVTVASDVTNPLTGPDGAASVYGPQKGASPQLVRQLDRALSVLGERILEDLGVDVMALPGAGAAGGSGAGAVAFLGARLRPGAELVSEAVGLSERLGGADLVVTGEGQIDAQTLFGKVPFWVAKAARQAGAGYVAAVCGSLGADAPTLEELGLDAVETAVDAVRRKLGSGADLVEAMREPARWTEEAAATLGERLGPVLGSLPGGEARS